MIASSVIFTVVIAIVVLLLTASINYLIAKNNGLNAPKWFLKGLILPFISIVYLHQEANQKKKKKKREYAKAKAALAKSADAKKDNELLKKEVNPVGLTYAELDIRKRRKKALLEEIKRKHQPKVDNLHIKTNEDLMDFMNGAWIYENPKNASIFQVFIFDDYSLKVDASFPRFAVSKKDISYTVTLMGNYLRIQDNPQKILITGRKEVIIGNRKLAKLTKVDHKELGDLLFTIGSDAELLFGSAVKGSDSKNYSVA